MKWLFSSIFGLIGVILLTVACPLLAVAGLLFYFVTAAPQDWVLVNGTVTGLSQSESYNSDTGSYSTVYCPYVEYTTNDGQSIEVNLNECSTPPMYSVGDPVEVYYDPQNPQNAQLKGGVRQVVGNIFVVVLGVIGGVLCLAGGGLMLFALIAALWRNKTPTPV